MYNSETTYIDRDYIFNNLGIDLNLELKDSATDNPTYKVNIFCKTTQVWLYQYIISHYEINEDLWEDSTFREALLWQVKHILKFGEDNKLDNTAYTILHEAGIINPQSEQRIYRRW